MFIGQEHEHAMAFVLTVIGAMENHYTRHNDLLLHGTLILISHIQRGHGGGDTWLLLAVQSTSTQQFIQSPVLKCLFLLQLCPTVLYISSLLIHLVIA